MDEPRVSSLLEKKTVSHDDDRWEAFRQVEIITMELTQRYKHSLGKYSRFFIELEDRRFLGTHCSTCDKVYTPPRPLCPDCHEIIEWQELSGEGTVVTYSLMHFTSGINDDVKQLGTPVVLAYVLLDGSSTLFPHILKAESVEIGMRVRVAYTDAQVVHPIHLMYFEPLEV